MNIKIHLYSNLQRFTSNQNLVEVQGETVGQCLNNLVAQFPALGPVIFNKDRSLNPIVYISINLKSAKSEQMDRRLNPGDEIYIIQIISGG